MATSRNKAISRWMFPHQSYPVPFNTITYYTTNSDCISVYNKQANKKRSTLSAPLLKALNALYDLARNQSNNGAMGISGVYSYAEYHSRSGALHASVYNANSGVIQILVKENVVSTAQNPATMYTAYSESEQKYDGTVIWMSMIPHLMLDSEFYAHLQAFLQTPDLTEERKCAAYILCDNIYRRVANGDIKFDPDIQYLSPNSFASHKPVHIAGEFLLFSCQKEDGHEQVTETEGNEPVVAKDLSNNILPAPKRYSIGAYKINPNRILSEKENQLVPVLDKSFVVSQEAKEICQMAYSSSRLPNPFRNFMLYGPAGTGKTSSSVAVAAGLGLPYTLVTCSPETEKIDLLGQILPASVKGTSVEFSMDPEMIEFDPETAYFQLTGEKKDSATSLDCIKEILDRVSKQSSAENGFYFQESELIKALKYGWVIELQEPTTITNPAALTCLNSIFDPQGLITLPNGEVIRRHPDCVIIITTNLSYEGCRMMNQAVLDRIQYSKYIPLPTKSVMVKRGMAKTGCADKEMVEKMADVIMAAEKFCSENFCDGVVGMRSFYNWITMAMITGNPYESALTTVISKAATDKQEQKSLKESVLENVFAAEGKNAMKRVKV